jgi:hypothetical protein
MPWNQIANNIFIGAGGVSSGTRANTPLNAAYNHLVSGPAVGYRFRAQKAGALQECYAFLDTTTGTRANISLRCRLYIDNNSGGATRPGNTLVATATNAALPASDDRWIRWEFPTLPILTFDENYWIVIDNLAAVPATDFPGILSGVSFRQLGRLPNSETILNGYSTTNGYTTSGSSAHPGLVYLVDGEAYGNPFTLVSSAYTSNQLRHGALFSNDLARFRYWTFQADGATASTNLFEVHDPLLAPGSGIIHSSVIPIAAVDTTGGMQFLPLLEVSGSGEFIVSVRSTVNTTGPSCFVIEGYSDYPAVFNQFFDNFTTPRAIQEAAGVWAIIPGAAARISLPASEFRSSGGSIWLPRNMAGGFTE